MHATALLVGDRGIIVLGASGSGKTTFALTLVAQARAAGLFSRIVADDQVFAEPRNGRLLCKVPAPIAGLSEVYGVSPVPTRHEPRAVIDLVVRLVPQAEAPRYGEFVHEIVMGVPLPLLVLAERSAVGATLATLARLGPGFPS